MLKQVAALALGSVLEIVAAEGIPTRVSAEQVYAVYKHIDDSYRSHLVPGESREYRFGGDCSQLQFTQSSEAQKFLGSTPVLTAHIDTLAIIDIGADGVTSKDEVRVREQQFALNQFTPEYQAEITALYANWVYAAQVCIAAQSQQ